MENLTEIFSFVSGNEQEQEKQKSEIEQYCKKYHSLLPQDIELFSDWEILKSKLNKKAVVVITDITVLSKIKNEIAKRLNHILYENRARVEIINKKQSELLENKQPDKLSERQFQLLKARLCAGLIEYVDKVLDDEKKDS